MKCTSLFGTAIFLILFSNYLNSCCIKKTQEENNDGPSPRKSAWKVVSLSVAELPGKYTAAQVTLPNLNTYMVSQQGGFFELEHLIDTRASTFSYNGELSPDAKLSILFNRDKASFSATNIFDDVKEEGNYQLCLSFENYSPDKLWQLTIKNVKVKQ